MLATPTASPLTAGTPAMSSLILSDLLWKHHTYCMDGLHGWAPKAAALWHGLATGLCRGGKLVYGRARVRVQPVTSSRSAVSVISSQLPLITKNMLSPTAACFVARSPACRTVWPALHAKPHASLGTRKL